MKRLWLLMVLLGSSLAFGAESYHGGNVLVGLGVGLGSPEVAPTAQVQFNIHPSIECIVGSWNKVALGLVGDFSFNFGHSTYNTIATAAPMLSLHTMITNRFDWYLSLGAGFQLLPPVHTLGIYRILVGFATGFNVMIIQTLFWNIGMAIHAKQIFGSTGLAYRFGKTN